MILFIHLLRLGIQMKNIFYVICLLGMTNLIMPGMQQQALRQRKTTAERAVFIATLATVSGLSVGVGGFVGGTRTALGAYDNNPHFEKEAIDIGCLTGAICCCIGCCGGSITAYYISKLPTPIKPAQPKIKRIKVQ
jgi:hypothetical protein